MEQHGSTINLDDEGTLARQGAVLERAAAIGLNRAYMGEAWPNLGVRLVDYRETLPELASTELTAATIPRRKIFEEICAKARNAGIDPWVNFNVINYPDHFTQLFTDAIATAPPTADRWMKSSGARGLSKQPQLCPSSASFRKLASAQTTELCRMPIDGVECWLTAADCDLFYCACEVCRTKSIGDVIVEFADYAHPICEAHGKKLLLRCYLGGWRCGLESDTWPEVATRIHPDIEIAYKQQNGDFMNWHGPNTLAGQLAPHRETVEFDLAGEYRGTNYGMISTVRWQLQELLQHFLKLGVTAVCCRGIDTTHPFDLDRWVFGALMKNPELDVAAWCGEWAARRYGASGGEVLAILDECAEIMQLAMYVRGVQWASWAVPQSLSRIRFILFDRSAPCVEGSYARLQPTPENIREIIKEKELALTKADALVERCARLEGSLDDAFFKPLFASVSYLRAYTAITGPLLESFFRFFAWSQTFSETSREYIRIPLVTSLGEGHRRIEKYRQEVERMNLAALTQLTSHAGFVDAKALNKFQEPFGYAAGILKEIEAEIDVESASWWAFYPSPERWPERVRGSRELYKDTRP